jgi:hypothetical protein
MSYEKPYKPKGNDNYLERLTRRWVERVKKEIRHRIYRHRLQDVDTEDVYPHAMKKAS